MTTLMTELSCEETIGTIYYTDQFGNLRGAEGIFWLAVGNPTRVAWKASKTHKPSLFCNLSDVHRFKPRT